MGTKKDMTAATFSLEDIVSKAIQLPGAQVSRDMFLTDTFGADNENLIRILEVGPVEAGCSRETLAKIANKLILSRTSASSVASFALGLPSAAGAVISIPADILQFFGVSLRLAQELAYLYGAQDLWKGSELDTAAVQDRMILYCGVMFGVSGASAGVRLLSSQIAKTTLKKLPQAALTKTLWYPIVKQIGKAIGIKVTKNTVAKGFSVAIPVIGGVISGGLTFASMLPMARRLASTFDEANFNYTEENVISDYHEVGAVAENDALSVEKTSVLKTGMNAAATGIKDAGANLGTLFAKAKSGVMNLHKDEKQNDKTDEKDVFGKIEKLAKLKEMGAITQEEYDTKKAELLSRI